MKIQKMGNRHDESNTSEVWTPKTKMTTEKTQNMLKSHSVFFLLKWHFISKHYIYIYGFSNLKWWER
jgi:hypothetical protein